MQADFNEQEKCILQRIADAAKELNLEAHIIGGFIRDKLLGRPVKDMDVVCEGDGIALAKRTAEKFPDKPAVAFFKNFGTAQIKIGKDDDSPFDIEFVGARKESYSTESRKPEVHSATFHEDIMRRDFTINTLAFSLADNPIGKIVDPLNALSDLENKIIRTPLDSATTFIDDPLRMLRAIRFAAQLNFTIERDTYKAIGENCERIKIVSGERIIDEINKMILSANPSMGFKMMYETGLLQLIFPQMVALKGAEYIDGKGHKDNFYHTLQVLDNIAAAGAGLWMRWAALLHDIAKPATKRYEEGHGWTFHGHEVVGGRMVPKIFTQLKLPLNDKMKLVRKMVVLHLRPISLTKENITDSAIRRLLVDAGEDIEDLMMLCKADITSKNPQKVKKFLANFEMVEQRLKEVEESDHLRNWQPPITGELIMKEFGLPPSRQVGDIKNEVREAILEGIISNDYTAAYEYMKKVGEKVLKKQ